MNYGIFQFINGFAERAPWLDAMMIGLAQGIVWVLIAVLAILWISGKSKNQKLVFYACLTALITIVLSKYVISPLVAHPRPFAEHTVHQLVAHEADHSFPSDHTAFAFALAFPIWFAKRRLGTILLVLAALTGIARIYTGVHYPFDIAGGLVLAFAASVLVMKLRHLIAPVPNAIIRVYEKLTRRIPFVPQQQQDTFK